MLAAPLEAEVNSYISELAGERDGNGRRLVVRDGYHQSRSVTTVAGSVEVRAPRVNDKRVEETTGERKRFSSPAHRGALVVLAVIPVVSIDLLPRRAGGRCPSPES